MRYELSKRQLKELANGKQLSIVVPYPPCLGPDHVDAWVESHLTLPPGTMVTAHKQEVAVCPLWRPGPTLDLLFGQIVHHDAAPPYQALIVAIVAKLTNTRRPLRGNYPWQWPARVTLDDGQTHPYTGPMSTKDLVAKYKGNSRQAINRAIRAELTGGDLVLDGLDRLNAVVRGSGSKEAGEALNIMRAVAAEMEAEIRRRYEMPPG